MNKGIGKLISIGLLSLSILMSPMEIKAKNIMFNNSTVSDELFRENVQALFQDSHGYMWVGTENGLNRYNGYDYKKYYVTEEDNIIINESILNISEDENSYLWVAMPGRISRLDLFDYYSVKNYDAKSSNPIIEEINDIAIDDKGRVFASTSKGLAYYSEDKDDFITINHNEGSNFSSLFSNGSYIYGINKGIIFKYNLDNDEFIEFDNEELSEIYNGDSISDIYVYNNMLLIGTNSTGLYYYNMDVEKIQDVKKYYIDENSGACYKIKTLNKDRDDCILVGTEKGLIVYGKQSEEEVFKNDSEDKYTIVNDNINTLLQDKSGSIWIGTCEGLSNVKFNTGIEYYSENSKLGNCIKGKSIHGIFEDIEGKLWFGSDEKGITILNQDNDTYEYISTDNGLSSNYILDITGNESSIFVSTDKGVDVIDRKTKKIKYTISEVKGIRCDNLYIDGYNLWIGSFDGVKIVNLNDNTMQNLDWLFEEYKFDENLTQTIFKDSKGVFWIGVSGTGLIKYNPVNNENRLYSYDETNNSISNNYITSINEDSLGDIWIGTENGLNKLSVESEVFEIFSTNDGLSNDNIQGIVCNKNQVWVSTNSGIDSISTSKDNQILIKNYIRNIDFNTNSNLFFNRRYAAFGSIEGLFIIDLIKAGREDYTYEVCIDSVYFNNMESNYVNSNIPHYNNSIGVKLFTTMFNNSQNTKYFYKINNVSEQWVPMDGNEITFSNLDSGTYTISFKALTPNGTYTAEENIFFTVDPPIWRSFYAVILYGIIFVIVVIYVLFKMRTMNKHLKKKDNQLDIEMKEKNELLLKVLKLEQSKIDYLINLSHELRTPLNVISSINQLLLKLDEDHKLTEEMLEKYIDMSDKNVKRLLKLINDLLDSSKIDSGNFKLFKEEGNIVSVVEDSVMSLKNLIEEKGASLIFDTETEECMMYFDFTAIDRCIVNLVNNAAKFTPSGG